MIRAKALVSCMSHKRAELNSFIAFRSVSVQFSHYTFRSAAQKGIITWQESPEEIMGLRGPGPSRYIEKNQNRKSLHG